MIVSKNIGIALFAYNRPSHLRRVLIALEDYKIDKIHIFIDGPKNNKDVTCQNEIMFMIKTNKKIKFKTYKSNKNKGLSKSLEDGMKIMSNKFSSFIILEDDCIPRKQFFDFIIKSLKTYENNMRIQAICGYQLPELHSQKSKTLKSIGLKNFMSWGWATWSKKYKIYLKKRSKVKKVNSPIIKKIKKMKTNKRNIWTLNFIKYSISNDNFFIFPNKSQVKNIGFDGSGVNSSYTFKFNTFYTLSNNYKIDKDIKIDLRKSKVQTQVMLKRINLFY